MKIIRKKKEIRKDKEIEKIRVKYYFKENTIKEIVKFAAVITAGMILFFSYLNFITYKGELRGEHTLYVKIDGRTGQVLKIDNKYLKKQFFIKNSRNLEYGTYLIKFKILKITEKNSFTTLEGKISGYRESGLNFIRKYILGIFDNLFITNDNLYAFSKASILGEKADISKDMNDRFKYTGLAHLIVISGSHISLVIMGIIRILDGINLGYRIKYIFALLILTLYCMLAGMSPGIMRAYIMGAMMILARLIFEKEDSMKSLVISFVIIVILNPYSIYDISMQLSYAAVIAIIFIYPPVEKIAEKKFFSKIEGGIIENTLKLLLMSFVIQITSMPLFLYYFKKLPVFSFFLNIAGVPIGTVLIEVLFLITLLNILKIEILNWILIPLAEFIYNSFEGFVFMGSRLPMLQVDVNSRINVMYIFIYYMILGLFLKILSRKD